MAGTQLDILYSLCQYLVTVSPPDRTGHEPHHPMLPSGSAAFILIVLCCLPLSMPGVFLQRFFSIFPISTRLTQSVLDLNYKSDSCQLILSTSDMLLFVFVFFATARQYDVDVIINVTCLAWKGLLGSFWVVKSVKCAVKPAVSQQRRTTQLNCTEVIALIYCG